MLTSVLSPISITTPDTAPPWGWNPAATFLTAYNTQAQARREQEKFNMAMQLERILLPAKAAQAEFTLNQLAYETENMANSYRLQNEMVNERRRIIRTGGSGASSNVAGNSGGSTPRTGSNVATLIQNWGGGSATPAGGGGGGKILGQGHTGDDY
jgi:hypothetical protein